MTDFFELPRPNPNPNLEILDMKSEGFQPSNSQPNSLNDPNKIKISPNNEIIGFSEEDDPNTDPVIIKNTLYSNQKQNQEKISELDVDDDKETYHESLAQDSTKKALTIIEESLDKIKKDEATKNLIFQTKKPIVNLHLSKKIQNIIDFGEADLGEVGEWVEKTANCNVNQEEEDKDSDFEDVFDDSKPKIFSENLPKISKEPNEDKNIKDKAKNVEKFGIGKSNTANKKNNNGYMLNNLKDKAKYMLLAQGVATSSQKETKEINEGDKANLMLEEKKTEDVFKKNLEEEKKIVNTNQDGENLEFSNKDWEEISKINLEKLNSSHIRMQSEEDVSPIFFPEMWQIIKSLDLSKEKKNIITTCKDDLNFFERIFFSCSVTKLPANLLLERDQIFAYAKVSFDDKNPLHFKILHTIYRKLTNINHCIRYGEHWEKIGFQGRDPATDLRGVGMLGLLQILAFITLNYDFIGYVYQYSLSENFHFPLAVGLLNMTEIMLQTLREGKLYKMILQQKSAINAVNTFYFAVFFKFFIMYKANKCTESDFGELKKKIMNLARGSPAKLIAEYIKDKDIFCKVNGLK